MSKRNKLTYLISIIGDESTRGTGFLCKKDGSCFIVTSTLIIQEILQNREQLRFDSIIQGWGKNKGRKHEFFTNSYFTVFPINSIYEKYCLDLSTKAIEEIKDKRISWQAMVDGDKIYCKDTYEYNGSRYSLIVRDLIIDQNFTREDGFFLVSAINDSGLKLKGKTYDRVLYENEIITDTARGGPVISFSEIRGMIIGNYDLKNNCLLKQDVATDKVAPLFIDIKGLIELININTVNWTWLDSSRIEGRLSCYTVDVTKDQTDDCWFYNIKENATVIEQSNKKEEDCYELLLLASKRLEEILEAKYKTW